MIGSIQIGRVLGIKIRVHWLFLALILFLVGTSCRGALDAGQPALPAVLTTTIWLGVLFGVVFLHELGHSLVARRFGIRVLDITFWPLGGMARMSEIPEDSRVEGLIAIAGPMVNFALAALVAPVWLWTHLSPPEAGSWMHALGTLSWTFLWINLVLGGFNLIPAFPMDGGRVLRAVLGRGGDWVGATEKAVRVGRVFALLMVLAGLLYMDSGLIFLPLIALFIWYAGTRELWAVRMRHAPPAFDAFAGQAARAFQAWSQAFGSAPGYGASMGDADPAPPAGSPSASDSTSARNLPRRGLSDEEIERLERYRGRLRGFGPSDG